VNNLFYSLGLSALILCAVLVNQGCGKKDAYTSVPTWKFEEVRLGTLELSEANQSSWYTFSFEESIWESWLVVSFDGMLNEEHDWLDGLELMVEIYSTQSNKVCSFFINKDNVFKVCWFDDVSFVVRNTEPFLHVKTMDRSIRYPTFYEFGRDEFPLKNGFFVSNYEYLMKVTNEKMISNKASLKLFNRVRKGGGKKEKGKGSEYQSKRK
jgi:hypothetical protein